jgi:predicted PurR-regulated permease PerM
VIGEISTVVVQLLRSVVIPVLTVYLIFDYERVNASIRQAVPPRHRDVFDGFVRRLDLAAGAYIKAQLLLATMVGTMIWLDLALLGVPRGTTKGVHARVGDLVQFFGTILAGIAAVLLRVESARESAPFRLFGRLPHAAQAIVALPQFVFAQPLRL